VNFIKSARRNRLKWCLPGLLIVALIAVFANPPDQAVTAPDVEYVQRVVDGDTLLFGTGERVRLIGVDTPEITLWYGDCV
jgi:endonuclease YncB( thermonuclease family)